MPPDWMLSRPQGLTAEDYESLPEEVCRRIEIVDGAVVVTPALLRSHQRVARRLANALEDVANERFAVDTDVDLRLGDVPLLNRRPDIVVYDASVPGHAMLRPEHCLLVVEVMSPTSMTTDRSDKPSEYAAAGIPHFWRVEDIDDVTRTMTVFRYRLDPTTGRYAAAGVDSDVLSVRDPIDLTINLAGLY